MNNVRVIQSPLVAFMRRKDSYSYHSGEAHITLLSSGEVALSAVGA